MLPTDRSSITSFNARRLILVIFLQRGDNLLAYKDKKTFSDITILEEIENGR